jgi:hypothetical protein
MLIVSGLMLAIIPIAVAIVNATIKSNSVHNVVEQSLAEIFAILDKPRMDEIARISRENQVALKTTYANLVSKIAADNLKRYEYEADAAYIARMERLRQWGDL